MREKFIAIMSQARNLTKAAAVAVFLFSAQAAQAVDTGLNTSASQAGLSAADTDVAQIIGRVVSEILGMVGVVFLVLMVYGGFLWMMAQGNEEQIKKARTIVAGAVTGTLIIFSAYVVVTFAMRSILSGLGVAVGPEPTVSEEGASDGGGAAGGTSSTGTSKCKDAGQVYIYWTDCEYSGSGWDPQDATKVWYNYSCKTCTENPNNPEELVCTDNAMTSAELKEAPTYDEACSVEQDCSMKCTKSGDYQMFQDIFDLEDEADQQTIQND